MEQRQKVCKYCDKSDPHVHNEAIPGLKERLYVPCEAAKYNLKINKDPYNIYDNCKGKVKKNNFTNNVCDNCLEQNKCYWCNNYGEIDWDNTSSYERYTQLCFNCRPWKKCDKKITRDELCDKFYIKSHYANYCRDCTYNYPVCAYCNYWFKNQFNYKEASDVCSMCQPKVKEEHYADDTNYNPIDLTYCGILRYMRALYRKYPEKFTCEEIELEYEIIKQPTEIFNKILVTILRL
jgi:hypothetical protein